MKSHINNINDILIKPLVTEKSYAQIGLNIYTFVVHKNATKTDIKKAIETIFIDSKVKVAKVNVVNVAKKAKKVGKYEGFKSAYKKAIVYLSEGTIPIFGQEEEADNAKTDKKPVKRRIITDDVLEGKEK